MAASLQALATRQPLAARFFEGALFQGRLAHAYVLKGLDTVGQYQLALILAQIVNCTQPPAVAQACNQCRNCRWIADNAHPAVITLTRLTYDGEGDTSTAKKLIRTGQITQLQANLALTSADFRVVIFADAEELPVSYAALTLAPAEWRNQSGNDSKSLHIRPLTTASFNEKTVNQFLKTLEEPHANTLFFFLTDSEANLLPTVVSRCQVVPFGPAPLAQAQGLNPEEQTFISEWWEEVQSLRKTREPFGVIHRFRAFWEESQGMELAYGVRQLQRWLRGRWQAGEIASDRYRLLQLASTVAYEQLKARAHSSTICWQWLTQLV